MSLKKLSILFCEDDCLTQETIKLFFEDEVANFYQAYNGEEAWELFNSYPIDVVITDINMPHLNGISLVKLIRSKEPNIPIIMLSAYDDKEILLEAIELGVKTFIPKPIDFEKLLIKLEEISKELYPRGEDGTA